MVEVTAAGTVVAAPDNVGVAIPGLRRLTADELNIVVAHPAQQRCVVAIAALLAELRECASPDDYDELQRELFRHIWETEGRRAEVRRCLKRTRRGERLPADAPELGNGLPPDDIESWGYEDLTYERLGRQLRCVGDALAWRVTGHDRAFIQATSRNAPSGPIVNKVGFDSELGVVTEIFRDRGHFVLLHDLTNCVRIGDATEFTSDGKRWLREVKKSPRRDPRQTQRMQQVVDALMQGAPLPGAPASGIVRLRTPLRTHLSSLADGLTNARERGLTGLLVPKGSRGLICASMPVMAQDPETDWLTKWDRQRERLQRRLGLTVGTDELVLNTGDTAAHATGMAPYGVFPIAPGYAAQLICDLAIVETRLPAAAVTSALQSRNLDVEFPIGGRNTEVTPNQASFHVRRGDRMITVHGNAIAQVLIEQITLETVADSIAEVLELDDAPREPAPIYADEASVWV